jgi:hypothetical protein
MAISNLKTWKIKRHFQFALNCTLSLALLFCIIMGTPYAQKTSAKSLIEYAITHKSPSDRIVSFETYFQDLPVYSHEKILVVNYLGELEFGTTVEDTSSWMMHHSEFSKLLNARTNTYWIFLKEDKIPSLYQHYPDIQFDVIHCDHNVCLVCNVAKHIIQNKDMH